VPQTPLVAADEVICTGFKSCVLITNRGLFDSIGQNPNPSSMLARQLSPAADKLASSFRLLRANS
jgi:hypothetical protein